MSSRKPAVVLSPKARSDLRSIVAYSAEVWGDAQAKKYLQKLFHAMRDIRKISTLGMRRSWLPETHRVYQIGKHIIIYWP